MLASYRFRSSAAGTVLEPAEQLREDLCRIGVRGDLHVGPPAARVHTDLVGVDVAEQATVALEEPDVALRVDARRRQPRSELVGGDVGLAVRGELVRVHQLEHRGEVVVARRP
jgi:hypothetical protein